MSTLLRDVHRLNDGAKIHAEANGRAVDITYQHEPSYGDNGFKVPGAYTGRYIVHDAVSGQRIGRFEHGPYAISERAKKMGASPQAKAYAAGHAYDAALGHLQAGVFNDRREKPFPSTATSANGRMLDNHYNAAKRRGLTR